jgi:hypothetical protein
MLSHDERMAKMLQNSQMRAEYERIEREEMPMQNSGRQAFPACSANRLLYGREASPSWSLQLQAAQSRYTHSASAVLNGLQAPPSDTRQHMLAMGVAWHY